MDLLSCPFCGAGAVVIKPGIFEEERNLHAVSCVAKACGVATKFYQNEKRAVDIWNRRAR